MPPRCEWHVRHCGHREQQEKVDSGKTQSSARAQSAVELVKSLFEEQDVDGTGMIDVIELEGCLSLCTVLCVSHCLCA